MSKEDKCGKNELDFVSEWTPTYENKRQVLFKMEGTYRKGHDDSMTLIARSNDPYNDEMYTEQKILSIKGNGELVFHRIIPKGAEILGLKLDKDNFIVRKKRKKQTRSPSDLGELIEVLLSEYTKV